MWCRNAFWGQVVLVKLHGVLVCAEILLPVLKSLKEAHLQKHIALQTMTSFPGLSDPVWIFRPCLDFRRGPWLLMNFISLGSDCRKKGLCSLLSRSPNRPPSYVLFWHLCSLRMYMVGVPAFLLPPPWPQKEKKPYFDWVGNQINNNIF